MKYRMYIDEVGNSDMGASINNPNHRYLSLTGVIFDLQYVSDVVFPTIERLKHGFFNSHPDEPIILHRKELVNLIAHPSYRATCARRNNEELPANFGGQIATILEHSKYHRNPAGRINGWGRKWLP